jgi:hypothetical protein
MKQEEIIKLAQEVGLIRAGENYTEPARWGISEITDFYNRAVAHEREACAKVCEERQEVFQKYYTKGLAAMCAEAIRARGSP